MKYKRDKKFIESIPEEWRDIPVGMRAHFASESGEMRFDCTYIGPNGGDCTALCITEEGTLRVLSYRRLTLITRWEPKKGEVVAAWDDDDRDVVFARYGYVRGGAFPYEMQNGACWGRIARIPEDFKLTPETLTVAWWRANGELYEADHE